MPDPIALTAAGIGSAALIEGIKFLYGQAGEILKRWRERRKEDVQEASEPEWITIKLPATTFEGNLTSARVDFDKVRQSENELRILRKDLAEYAEEIEEVDEADAGLLGKVDALRNILEAIYQQHITFKGENRPPSGDLVVAGRLDVKEIAGRGSGVEAELITKGEVSGEVKADRIEQGGDAAGVRVKTVSGDPRTAS